MKTPSLLFLFFFVILYVSVDSRDWDFVVNKYHPSSNLFEHTFRTKQASCDEMKFKKTVICQRDINICIDLGRKLYKKYAEIEEFPTGESFPSQSVRLFFSSMPSQDISIPSKCSKEMLLTTKVLQKMKFNNNQFTPNTFLEFLENNKLKVCKSPYSNAHSSYSEIRSYDGSNNNMMNPLWGTAFTPYTRLAQANYNDGLYEIRKAKSGNLLPSPRQLSNILFTDNEKYSNIFSNMVVFWGQLVAHDLSLRVMEQSGENGAIQCCAEDGSFEIDPDNRPSACAPIIVPCDDPFYSSKGIQCLNYVRSVTAPAIDNTLGAAQQMNVVSNFLDGSTIYSSKLIYANKLRLFEGGKLEVTSRNMLPFSPDPNDTCDNTNGKCPCYLAGDIRINQTPSLVALHTILSREHNRIAGELEHLNPNWNDEKLFQESRKIVMAEIQHITYHEWMPLCLGEKYLKQHKILPIGFYSYDYDVKVNPGILNEFATAAFRFFHSLISGYTTVYPTENRKTYDHSRLSQHLLNPHLIENDNGLDAVLRGLLNEPTMDVNPGYSSEIRNYLFKSANKSGMDLASIDTQRGRDHGLENYNTYRSICGLKRATCFEDLSSEISNDRITLLKSIYEHVDDIDLFVGGSMENSLNESILGPTFQCIVGEQFYRTRVGDQYFYDIGDKPHSFTPNQLKEIKKISLGRIICDNCHIQNIQSKAFKMIGEDNPLYYCNDTNNLPTINLEYWREK